MPEIVYAGISVDKDGFWAAIRNGGRYRDEERLKFQPDEIHKKIYSWLFRYAIENRVKIVGAGIVGDKSVDDLTADLWLKQDIVPFVFNIKGSSGRKKSISAALEVAKRFGNDDIIDIKFDAERRVRTVRLARLDDFRRVSGNRGFSRLKKLAGEFKEKKIRMIFISSTPRGGGVALMRHSLIRLYRLLGIDVSWYVMSSKKAIFEVTKNKFHNILQGVGTPGSRLNKDDKRLLAEWTRKNADRFSDIFKETDVIVIDDPQPSGLIPFIKRMNPRARIIYRSHIQINADLIRKRGTAQSETWNYIWGSVKGADVFVSHPVTSFIPRNVPVSRTVLMPATTDKLDGLNKDLSDRQIRYYLDIFDRELIESKQVPLDRKRPYIVQIARFDPSKGINDVLESFRKLRNAMYKAGCKQGEMPQLVIAGHGSVDDPEAFLVYHGVLNILKMDTFRHYASDIKVLRLPPHDQVLNALMRRCFVALQLSYREGFEIKVSEALEKGKPVIAYRTGGIPFQIEDGVTGYLVEVGQTSRVAEHLYDLLTDRPKYRTLCRNAREKVNRDYFAVENAIRWLFLAVRLVEKGKIDGGRRQVDELINRWSEA